MRTKKRKHSKKYYIGGKKARKDCVTAGMNGFFITCAFRERDAVLEAYRLLNEHADKLYGPESLPALPLNDDSVDDDVEASIRKEVAGIKESSRAERRFLAVSTRVGNSVFIRTTLDDPTALANSIFEKTEEGVQNIRHCYRFAPVIATCYASTEEILKCAKKIIPKYFHGDDVAPSAFCITWRVRCNHTVKQDDVVLPLSELIENGGSVKHRVEYLDPDLVLNLDVLANVCCIGILRNFKRYKKYNLFAVASKKGGGNSAVGGSVEKGITTADQAGASVDIVGSDKTSDSLNSQINECQKSDAGHKAELQDDYIKDMPCRSDTLN